MRDAPLPLQPFVERRDDVPSLRGFEPAIVDRDYLEALGVNVVPSDATVEALVRGSHLLRRRLDQGTLIPRSRITIRRDTVEGPLQVHNYTGTCPTSTYEVNPIMGCHVGCLYCLVSDGSHERELELLEGYPEYLARALDEKLGQRCFFYFSPKTEALQEPTLQTGLAHEILRVFIRHFRDHPRSQCRLFMATKAGYQHLAVRHDGETILDLFVQLTGKMQFNTSVSIMLDPLRALLEPHAATIEDRLEAVVRCQRAGVLATSALVQPILLPFIDDAVLEGFLAKLRRAGIRNVKPELLTVNMENLALIGQLVGHFDKDRERRLYELYIAPDNASHTKQRARTAPDRGASRAFFERVVRFGQEQGISTSICYWVRKELGLSEELIPLINRNGYQCLGYQQRLFDEPRGGAPERCPDADAPAPFER